MSDPLVELNWFISFFHYNVFFPLIVMVCMEIMNNISIRFVRRESLLHLQEWLFKIQENFSLENFTLLGLYFHRDKSWAILFKYYLHFLFSFHHLLIDIYIYGYWYWSLIKLQLNWLNLELEKIWPYVNEVTLNPF